LLRATSVQFAHSRRSIPHGGFESVRHQIDRVAPFRALERPTGFRAIRPADFPRYVGLASYSDVDVFAKVRPSDNGQAKPALRELCNCYTVFGAILSNKQGRVTGTRIEPKHRQNVDGVELCEFVEATRHNRFFSVGAFQFHRTADSDGRAKSIRCGLIVRPFQVASAIAKTFTASASVSTSTATSVSEQNRHLKGRDNSESRIEAL